MKNINKKLREKINQTKKNVECRKDFICLESDLEILCKAKTYSLAEYLECIEKNPQSCNLVIAYADSYFCNCPVRKLIKKETGK